MDTKKSLFSEWLEKIQQESWQLELLISGFAIYGLFNALDLFNDFGSSVVHKYDNPFRTFMMMGLMPLYVGLCIFITNLLVHVFIRGLWIGAIGLRYVSGDIDFDALNYSDRFTNFYKKKIGSFDDYIERLEKFSSIIFSFTFLLLFIFISAFAFIVSLMLISFTVTSILNGEIVNTPYELGFYMGKSRMTAIIVALFWAAHLFFGLFVLLDFLSLGLLKRIKNKYFSTFFYYIHKYFSLITVSFLMRPLLLNFLDDKFTRRILWLSVPYGILVAVILPSISYNSYAYMPQFYFYPEEYRSSSQLVSEYFLANHYDEEIAQLDQEERYVPYCSLPSKRVSGSLGEVFIKMPFGVDEYILHADSTLTPFNVNGLVLAFNDEKPYKKKRQEEYSLFNENLESKKDQMESDSAHLDKDGFRKLWNNRRAALRKSYRDSMNNVDHRNLNKIKKIMKSTIELDIDHRVLNHDQIECGFYEHSLTEAKGLLCYFPLDSLSIGRHFLGVHVLESRFQNSNLISDTVKIRIPFIYESANQRK